MLDKVLLYAGLACIIAVVVLSIETRFFIKRRSAAAVGSLERSVLIRMMARTLLSLLALVLLVLSHVLAN